MQTLFEDLNADDVRKLAREMRDLGFQHRASDHRDLVIPAHVYGPYLIEQSDKLVRVPTDLWRDAVVAVINVAFRCHAGGEFSRISVSILARSLVIDTITSIFPKNANRSPYRGHEYGYPCWLCIRAVAGGRSRRDIQIQHAILIAIGVVDELHPMRVRPIAKSSVVRPYQLPVHLGRTHRCSFERHVAENPQAIRWMPVAIKASRLRNITSVYVCDTSRIQSGSSAMAISVVSSPINDRVSSKLKPS